MNGAQVLEVENMKAQDMKVEMMRMLSTTAVLASGVSLGVGAVIVAIAALLQ
jgi:hypothetical protein